MKFNRYGCFAAVLAVFSAGMAYGHARFTLNGAFQSRTGNSGLKTAPCGSAAAQRSANPTLLKAGQQVSVEWLETINHQGRFEINFSLDGQTFDQQLMVVEDNTNNINDLPHRYEAQVTLPTTTCDQCVLQLVQVMVNNGAETFYYSCADIEIRDANDPTLASPAAPSGLQLQPAP